MLRWLQYVLSGVAVIAISAYTCSLGERQVSQAYLNREFTRSLERPALAAPPSDIVNKVNEIVVDGAQPLGRLEIPSIDLSAVFVEGVDGRSLRRAVGHIPGTALPGMTGNVGLSAHRDTFFRSLRKLNRGDVIWITMRSGRYKYIVESLQIVEPEANNVLRVADHPTLTLVTCYPFYYIGPAPKRFIVHAAFAQAVAH